MVERVRKNKAGKAATASSKDISLSKFYEALEMVRLASSSEKGLRMLSEMQLDRFFFFKGWLYSTDGMLGLACPSPFGTKLNGAIKSEVLFALISNLQGDSSLVENARFNIEVNDTSVNIVIEKDGHKVAFSIQIEQVGEAALSLLMQNPEGTINNTKWQNLPKDFIDALDVVSFSVANTSLVPGMQYIEVKGPTAVAANNSSASKYTLSEKPMDCNVPAACLGRSINLPNKVQQHGITRYSCREDGAMYYYSPDKKLLVYQPPVKDLITKEQANSIYKLFAVDPKAQTVVMPSYSGLVKAMERAKLMVDKGSSALSSENYYVILHIHANEIVCKGQGQAGMINETLPVKLQVKQPTSVKIDVKTLTRCLENGAEIKVGENALYLLTKNYIHVLAREK